MRKIVIFYIGLILILYSCGEASFTSKVPVPTGPDVAEAPVTTHLIPTSFNEDVQSFITLVYNDANGDLATSCSVSNLSNVTITQACSCTFGTCTVGVTGTANFTGSASFDFSVTANGDVSNTSSAFFTVDPVDDAPVISSITHQTTTNNIATSAISFTVSDVDSTLTCAGSVSASSSNIVLIANGSIMIGGTAPNCTVTLNPETDKAGAATITLDLTDGISTVQEIFTFWVNGNGWEQEAYIKASNADTSDYFGTSVSLSGDTLAVGAQYEASNETTITNGTSASSDNSVVNSGATYVYKRSGINWIQEAYIKAANADGSDTFGQYISLNGNTLGISSLQESSNQTTITNGTTASGDNSSSASGAVYVFKRTGTTWEQEAYIKASNGDAGDIFGSSLSLSGDTLAIGAIAESSNQTIITNGTAASSDNSSANSGAAYIFKRTGSSWSQEAYVKAANADAGDMFGFSLALSGDTLAVGSLYESSNQTNITNGVTASSDNSSSSSGAVYVYKRIRSSWAQEAYIKSSNAGISDQFGYSVSLSGDTLAVGANNESSNQTTITNGTTASADNSSSFSGAVYVYKRTGSLWNQEAYIKASNADVNDSFGWALSISANTLAVTALRESSNQVTITNGTTASGDNSSVQSGAVYVYKRTGTSWDQEAYIKG